MHFAPAAPLTHCRAKAFFPCVSCPALHTALTCRTEGRRGYLCNRSCLRRCAAAKQRSGFCLANTARLIRSIANRRRLANSPPSRLQRGPARSLRDKATTAAAAAAVPPRRRPRANPRATHAALPPAPARCRGARSPQRACSPQRCWRARPRPTTSSRATTTPPTTRSSTWLPSTRTCPSSTSRRTGSTSWSAPRT
jgi:hypothetical protein